MPQIYLFLLAGVHNQKSLEPTGLNHQPKVKIKAKGDAQKIAAQPCGDHFTETRQPSFGELQGFGSLLVSPTHYWVRRLSRELEHSAKASANLPARCCGWGRMGCKEQGNTRSPHGVTSPIHQRQQVSHKLSRLLPSSSCRKAIGFIFSIRISEQCCVPSTWCSTATFCLEDRLQPAVGVEKHPNWLAIAIAAGGGGTEG